MDCGCLWRRWQVSIAPDYSLTVELKMTFWHMLSYFSQRMDELEDAKETPEEMASNFACVMFPTPDDVLRGARHMVMILTFSSV